MAKEDRFAIIRYAVGQLRDVGKTKTQKLIYFLQYVFCIPLEYVYKMHYFGPYSEELNDDLIDMRSHGYIAIERDPSGYGYHITLGNEAVDSMANMKEEHVEKLDNCLEKLGGLEPRTLELLGAIHFVKNVALRPLEEKSEVIEMVARLKPAFEESAIEEYYEVLEGLGALK